MADDDWRKRVGIEINFSSDDDCSDDDTRNIDTLDAGDCGDGTNNSLDGSIDGLHIDEILKNDSRSTPKVVHARKVSQSKQLCAFKPYINADNSSASINRAENDHQKMEQDKRKRCLKLLRESQRDFKLDRVNLPTSNVSFAEPVDDRSESLPVIKVETSNRFMSLSSKLVPTNQSDRGVTTNETICCSPPEGESVSALKSSPQSDRISYHRAFSHLIRYGNADKMDKTSRRQLSREEHLWQSELKDLIWLELQAWHADRTPTEQDQFVCQERTKIAGLLDEIMNYHFVRKSAKELKIKKSTSYSSKLNELVPKKGMAHDSVFDDNSTENTLTSEELRKYEISVAKPQTQSGDSVSSCLKLKIGLAVKGGQGINGDDEGICEVSSTTDSAASKAPVMNGSDPETNGIESHSDEFADDCPGCYSMYCKVCMANQNCALGEVESILHRLGYAESLYPSSKALAMDYPLFRSQEFIMRIKAMCLWYNMTRHHLLKIIILGKLLLQFKAKKQNWPLDYRDGSGTPIDADSSPWTSTSSSQSSAMTPSESSGRISVSSISSGIESSNSALNAPHSPEELDDEFDRQRREIIQAVYRSEMGSEREDTSSCTRKVSRVTFALDCFEPSEGRGVKMSYGKDNDGSNRVHSVSGEEISSHAIFGASMSMLGEETMSLKCKSENGAELSPYQVYIERMLKTKGLRKALHFIERLHRFLLSKSRISLQKPKTETSALKCPLLESRVPAVVEGTPSMSEQEEKELLRHGYWCPEAQDTGLPSYIAAFLFICRIPLDVIHAYMQIRCQQKPKDPSVLSIRQLMREFREGLQIAVLQRQRYLHLIRTALWNAEPEILRSFEDGVNGFDISMKNVLEAYLEYLQQWVLMVQQESLLISTYQKNLLEEEWLFVKSTCPHIPGGEALAGNSFCQMAKGMLRTIGEYLNSEIDDLITDMDENWSGEDCTKHVMLAACRSLHSIFTEARERALKGISFAKTLRKDLEIAASFSLSSSPQNLLKRLQQTDHVRVIAPNACKHLIFIPGFIRHCPEQIRKLVNMNCSVGDYMGVGSEKSSGTVGLAAFGQEMSSPSNPTAPVSLCAPGPQCGVYLLLVRVDSSNDSSNDWNWEGECVSLQPTAEIIVTLSHVEVEGVLLIACDPSQLATHRRLFMDTMAGTLNIVRESRPSNGLIAQSLVELKSEALNLRNCITDTIVQIEERCAMEYLVDLEDCEKLSIIHRSREILHQCYKFGFEYHKELSRLMTGEARTKLSLSMIEFARHWMAFVQLRCERGRGLRPRWAQQGLEFLSCISDPRHTQCITDSEFEDLKNSIEKCLCHVIGSALERSPSSSASLSAFGTPTSLIPSPASSRPSSPHPVRRIFSSNDARSGATSPLGPKAYRSSRSLQEAGHHDSPSDTRRRNTMHYVNGGETLAVPSKGSFLDLSPQGETPPSLSRMERVRKAVSKLDSKLEESLMENELIGRVAPEAQRKASDHIHIRARSVTFSWQRGIKLGQGRFGKVYTAVNNRTGELMAMKEIPLHPNDHRTVIRSVAEELRIFEGIHHRHLVRYYGVEIHREEMLIFMEYCAEGTLENLVADTEEAAAGGLPEPIIRRYTFQLLQAVATLHHHGIVHRDIKSANIFLTDEGNCLKLGDFGSAVQIKAHTTLPGELQSFVGTQAYMAPEVFMKTTHEGHGRAADIWSVGCVVVEMTSGKRPWHEYDSNYQIMFKVGMGEIPAWPSTLSQEGEDFLHGCLQHDSRKRETAASLLNHTFVKVEVDEEYQSLPLPSILEDYLKDNLKK
ncbi:mitogen-activated protein kinase kinase kinase 4 isoform X2 [Ischnura elegans]|uniref:mitogen-activated protein kinase kinase kinase 4 isoform X2 n=1 Tax=Ischnura elegans TaxID=197161 RepID=UPI001ED884B4|nr:mitogen-activated protein kinase kinase kinase 4 isoform X2 [Ischnura elegans]